MKTHNFCDSPDDAKQRRAVKPVICYPTDGLPESGLEDLREARKTLVLETSLIVPPRDARCFTVEKGAFFRIRVNEGSQVGDLNLWKRDSLGGASLDERFFSGKTRALHGTHLSTGDRLWSSFPFLRPLATISHDTLDWYGFDADGGSVHDVIGTRCDPYTAKLLTGDDYHHCCHSNLTRALAEHQNLALEEAEKYVHDVLNVFMCTGFDAVTHQYFMKASPARVGDYIEFFAETDLLGALSTCPGGDCGAEHSSDSARCYALAVDIFKKTDKSPARPAIAPSTYPRTHGPK